MESQSDGCPPGVTWRYDRSEVIADGVIHVLGIALAVAGIIGLAIVAARWADGAEIASVAVYGAGLLAVLSLSAAYNLWPISPAKWVLRRFDHSAIFLLIAGTYTPFMVQLKNVVIAGGLLAGIWTSALAGIVLKLTMPGRFDRLTILLYLALGWSGVVVYEAVFAALPASTLWLLGAGGALYTIGVIFHVWHSLRFQNAIWHAFVLLAAICHYFAVLGAVAFAGP